MCLLSAKMWCDAPLKRQPFAQCFLRFLPFIFSLSQFSFLLFFLVLLFVWVFVCVCACLFSLAFPVHKFICRFRSIDICINTLSLSLSLSIYKFTVTFHAIILRRPIRNSSHFTSPPFPAALLRNANKMKKNSDHYVWYFFLFVSICF